MLFNILNAGMILCLVLAIFHGWRYWYTKRPLSSFIAILCGAVFSFYVIVLGIATAFKSAVALFASAFAALFPH